MGFPPVVMTAEMKEWAKGRKPWHLEWLRDCAWTNLEATNATLWNAVVGVLILKLE